MVQRTWEQRELVLLTAIGEGEQSGEDNVQNEWLVERTDLSDDNVGLGLRALAEAEPPYILGQDASSMGDRLPQLLDLRLTERGRRTVGEWPSENAGDALLELLEQRIDAEPDPTEKTRLQKLAETARGIGRETLTQLIAAAAKQAAGF